MFMEDVKTRKNDRNFLEGLGRSKYILQLKEEHERESQWRYSLLMDIILYGPENFIDDDDDFLEPLQVRVSKTEEKAFVMKPHEQQIKK